MQWKLNIFEKEQLFLWIMKSKPDTTEDRRMLIDSKRMVGLICQREWGSTWEDELEGEKSGMSEWDLISGFRYFGIGKLGSAQQRRRGNKSQRRYG